VNAPRGDLDKPPAKRLAILQTSHEAVLHDEQANRGRCPMTGPQPTASAEVEALAASLVLAEECFRHSWDMSDERRIDGAWVAGLCCECGAFVPYGQEVAHVAAALAPLIAAYVQAARDEERARG
jgi:hypothetical protein